VYYLDNDVPLCILLTMSSIVYYIDIEVALCIILKLRLILCITFTVRLIF